MLLWCSPESFDMADTMVAHEEKKKVPEDFLYEENDSWNGKRKREREQSGQFVFDNVLQTADFQPIFHFLMMHLSGWECVETAAASYGGQENLTFLSRWGFPEAWSLQRSLQVCRIQRHKRMSSPKARDTPRNDTKLRTQPEPTTPQPSHRRQTQPRTQLSQHTE